MDRRFLASLVFAAAVGLPWVPLGIVVCNPGQWCSGLAAFAGVFVVFDVVFYVVPQYLALMWLTVDVVPRALVATGALALTLSLAARGPWNPTWMVLGVACAALAWWLSGWVPERSGTESLTRRAVICALVVALYWAIGSESVGTALVVDGPALALLTVLVFGLWRRYTLQR